MLDEISDFERGVYLDMAWCPADTMLGGRVLRPLSLGSAHAVEMMGLTVMAEGHGLTLEEETRQVAAYIWLHSEDLEVVWRALWNGAWLAVLDGIESAAVELVEDFRVMAERARAVAAAAAVRILPRDKGDAELPGLVVGPTEFAHRAAVVMGVTGAGWREVVWGMPLGVALQIYHAEMRMQGNRTARPARRVDTAVFDDFGVAAIDTPPEL